MALLSISQSPTGKWRALYGGAVLAGAAALFPAHAVAQVAGATVAEPCAAPVADRPVQLAALPIERPSPSAGPLQNSKAAAILGGSVSKLEQMRLAQAAGEAPAIERMSATPVPAAADLRACAPAMSAPVAPAYEIPENAILGSLSVEIKSSPFDREWSAISARRGGRKMQRALDATGARNSADLSAQVEAVNRWVNQNIAFGDDRAIYGRNDYWASAAETLRRGAGDCEDFAIAKMELLSALGIARDRMRLVVARDLVRNADHAVLVVSLAEGAVMLDNVTDRLLDARLPHDYRPIVSFSQNAKWVHGYAVQPVPQVRMAALEAEPQSPAAVEPQLAVAYAETAAVPVSIAMLSVPSMLPTAP